MFDFQIRQFCFFLFLSMSYMDKIGHVGKGEASLKTNLKRDTSFLLSKSGNIFSHNWDQSVGTKNQDPSKHLIVTHLIYNKTLSLIKITPPSTLDQSAVFQCFRPIFFDQLKFQWICLLPLVPPSSRCYGVSHDVTI